MQGIKNYTVQLFSQDEYPKTKNITAEDALLLMKAIDLDKKHVIIGGEMYAVHQIVSIFRNFSAEADETYGKQITEAQRKTLDVRYLKHGSPQIADQIKKIAQKKAMPPIIGSAENPEI